MLPASSDWRIALVLVGISFYVALMRLLLPLSAGSLTGGFLLLIFQVFACFGVDGWSVEVSCSVVSQPLWPACWIDTPDRSSSSVSRTVQDAWDVYRDEFGVVPPGVVPCSQGMRLLGLLLMIFGLSGVGAPRLFYLALILRLVVPLWLAALLLLKRSATYS